MPVASAEHAVSRLGCLAALHRRHAVNVLLASPGRRSLVGLFGSNFPGELFVNMDTH